MKIIIDAMSGDNAPAEILKGAVMAVNEFDADITVVGDEKIIESTAKTEGISLGKIEIVNAASVINMEDEPMSVVRAKKNSSMSVGLKLLSEGCGDAFVSAGNTGALLVGATLIARRIKGIRRPGIATILPLKTPLLLLDSGANLEITADGAEEFAAMGSIYMKKIYGIEKPRVGQANNGTEQTKGKPIQIEIYDRLSASEDINFVGNIEGKMIPFSHCDVLVADGFTGNIILKTIEAMGKFIFKELKGVFYSNIFTKLSALMLKGKINKMRKKFDASEHGGAPILGIAKPVIKAHGSSDAKAIKNAVKQAISFVNTGVNEDIAEWASKKSAKKESAE